MKTTNLGRPFETTTMGRTVKKEEEGSSRRPTPQIRKQEAKRVKKPPKIITMVNTKKLIRRGATQKAPQVTRTIKNTVNDRSKIPVGGRLFRFRAAWEGANCESIARIGLSWTWEKKPPKLKRLRQRTSPNLDKILITLKRKRVIEKAKALLFQSILFTVPKKDSEEDRLILDLSPLNEFIKRPHFKMLTIREVKLILPKDYWTISIDLKDGFWHVGVSRTKRPFLGFRYRNQDWQFRAMPFGLNVAPRIFTKVVAHVVKLMAKEGIWCLPYHDNLLIATPTRELCLRQANQAISILKSLGWIINDKKSRLEPAQVFVWLGVQFDLISHTATAPQEKMELFQEKLKSLITSRSCTVREIMQLQGLSNWIGQCDPVIRLLISRTRRLIWYFRRFHPDYPIILEKGVRISLCKWVSHVSVPQSLGSPSPNIVVQTDASLKGRGFLINDSRFWGRFDKSMNYDICILEMLTIWYALIIIYKKNAVIQVLCDNTTAVQSVTKGTSTNPYLSLLTELIWRRAASLQWTLYVSHIKGCYNVLADQLSRTETVATEWSLPRKSFKEILKQNPNLQVDLFASSLNHQLKTFISPCPDKKAVAVDALSTPWDQWDHLYLYPPTNLILKALPKLTSSPFKTAVLVTPDTPTRPWYMSLRLRKVPSFLLKTTVVYVSDKYAHHSR